MAKNKSGIEPDYHSISSTDDNNGVSDDKDDPNPKVELGSHPPMVEHRSWWITLIWQTFALLWLVPMIALLYLNFTHYIIGASAWCPGGDCRLDAFNFDNSIPQRNMKRFDKEDHNLLGGLQFVAKALEIWFGVIAAALIYLITMNYAGMREGLPVAYLTRPIEFADAIALIDPLLWTTGPSPLGAKSAAEKRLGRRVWMLIALSIFLCVLINLMGPATAILVIPALQWIQTPNIASRQFSQLNSVQAPLIGSENWLWWMTTECDVKDFEAHDYACTQSPFGDSLDSWIATALSGSITGLGTQGLLTFKTNWTSQFSSENSLQQVQDQLSSGPGLYSDVILWAPSRQMNLEVDQAGLILISRGYHDAFVQKSLAMNTFYPDPAESYAEYNKSLELQIRRNGPVMGTLMNKYVDYNDTWHYTISVDASRQIRCYAGYNLGNAPMSELTQAGRYTKCIRTGNGWSSENKNSRFYVPGAYDSITNSQHSNITVDVYSSDHAVFLPNGTVPSWLPSDCLSPTSTLNRTHCDWNRLFTTDPAPVIANRTRHVNTVEFSMRNGNVSTMLAVDFVAYLAFTEYTFDPFPSSNPLLFVATGDLPHRGTTVAVDPAWILAGWSAGPEGYLLSNRTSTNLLQDVMTRLSQNTGEGVRLGLREGDYKIDQITFIPIMHTLSLIDHTTSPVPKDPKKLDQDHPLLVRSARMYVWAYGLGSRTSYLGTAVALAGALVVVWQFVLGFVDRRHYRSPTQLVVAALEHSPNGEFEGKNHDEKAMAKVRFHIKDDSGHSGKFSFYKPLSDDGLVS